MKAPAEKGLRLFFPRYMKKIHDIAYSGLPKEKCHDQVRPKNARMLCDLVVERLGREITPLLETKTAEKAKSLQYIILKLFSAEQITHIAAAASFGNLQALRIALHGEADNVWNESHLFGYPLALAAAGGHLDVVRPLVKYFEKT